MLLKVSEASGMEHHPVHVLWSHESIHQIFFARNVSPDQRQKDHPDCYQQHVKSRRWGLWWEGVVSKLIEILQQRMLLWSQRKYRNHYLWINSWTWIPNFCPWWKSSSWVTFGLVPLVMLTMWCDVTWWLSAPCILFSKLTKLSISVPVSGFLLGSQLCAGWQ